MNILLLIILIIIVLFFLNRCVMFTPESDGADPLGVATVPPGPSLEKTNKKIKQQQQHFLQLIQTCR